MTQTDAIREHARQILTMRKVDCVIGYSVSPRNRTRPEFVYQAENVDRLVWNRHATHNLTRYLGEKFKDLGKEANIGIVVKPCDSKALNVLIAENKVDRERLHVIGVRCRGIFSGTDEERLRSSCMTCDMDQPLIFDFMAENGKKAKETVKEIDGWSFEIEDINPLTPIEKSEFWAEQFDRCIRCYACRQVCPICDCPICIYERDDALWIGAGNSMQEKRAFHLGRALHLAGRCVACNACVDVCPVNFPIRLLNQKISQYVENHFGYEAGNQISFSPLVTEIRNQE